MEDTKFEALVNNNSLYPREFVTNFGMSNAHWELENWQRRERSLCHDMICVLLANLEPSETIEQNILNRLRKASSRPQAPPPKRPRMEQETTQTGETRATDSDDENISSSDDSTGIDSDDDEFEYNPIKEFEEMHPDIMNYRYIVLEGSLNASEIQSHFCAKWGLSGINKLFDIIDTKEKLLIEVKTTTRVPEILKDYSDETTTSARTCLIVVDMTELTVTAYNKIDEMPGLSKVSGFLIQRQSNMKILGLEDRSYNEVKLSKLIFKSEYLNQTADFIEKMLMDKISDDFNFQNINVDGFNIETVTQEKMFEYLKKPLLEDHEEKCVYKGKLTPFFYCTPMCLDDEKDIYAVDAIFAELFEDINLIEGDQEIFQATIELTNRWMESQNESKNFGFIDLKTKQARCSLSSNVKDSLMIGKKGKTFNMGIDNPKQPEREEIKEKGYPNWFQKLYEELSKKSEFNKFDVGIVEKHSNIPLYRHLGEWLNKFYNGVGERNLGGFMDQIMNFYSRLSGSYNTTIGIKTTHSTIAAIPIRFNCNDGEIVQRWTTGIAIRGPHHMRSATDKSNLLVIERVNMHKLPAGFYKKPTIVKSKDQYYIIRKTAIKKIDGIHLTFISNALFIASNMIGDIIMKRAQFTSEDAFKALCSSHLTNDQSMNFFIDRVIDAVLMAVLGNPRDEGYLSVFRKFFMVMLNIRRQQNAFTFDVRGMCEKLNDCLIDNPFSMFLQNSLLFMICNL